MEKHDFKITANAAEAMEMMHELTAVDMGFVGVEAAPFDIGWPNSKVSFVGPHGGGRHETTRFLLPALHFDGKEIARLGFRNKDGFMLVRNGLDTEIMMACASRFRQMAEIAVRNVKDYRAEMQGLRDRAAEMIFTGLQQSKNGAFSSRLEIPDPHKTAAAVNAFFADKPHVVTRSDPGVPGNMSAILLSPTSKCSLSLFNMSWFTPQYGRKGEDIVVKADLWDVDSTNGYLSAFIATCMEGRTLRITSAKTAFDESKLIDAVKSTDFGYM